MPEIFVGNLRGPVGPKGDPLKFEDLTPEQIEQLRGPQGLPGEPGLPGEQGIPGQSGSDGKNGATFTPTVSSSGDLSWTNDQGLENPVTVNIKGPKGDAGQDGKAFTFSDFTPEQLEELQGPQGEKGEDGLVPSISFRYDEESGLLYYSIDEYGDGDTEAY